MSVLVHIPARAGSKGVPGKNLRLVGGISLVGHAVRLGREFLRRRGMTGVVFVDTDGEAIAEEGRRWGATAPFLRAAELATDDASTVDTVLAALQRLEATGQRFESVVLLQPTSPLRTLDDVEACWQAHLTSGTAITTAAVAHPIARALRVDGEQALVPVGTMEAWSAPRQQHAPAFVPNGAVYATRAALLREQRAFLIPGRTRGVVMPPERSVDVDDELDLRVCDALLAARPLSHVDIAGVRIGPQARCFVIAEAGVNHNGDVALAHRLVDVAADAGADAVKFQTFTPEKLASASAPSAEYQTRNTGRDETQASMLRRLVLPHAAHAELQRHAADRGLLFLSTPFDEESADFLEGLGVPAFKIPSGEITNHGFLAHLARKGRPLLMSSGMASMVEVAQAIDVIAAHGGPPLAVFHCVTSYPATAADTNLRAIDTMRAAFGVPAGLSDHTQGIAITLAAVARGAQLIEKHFTLDRAMEGPDHKASLEPHELKELMRALRDVEAALGDGVKAPRPAEVPLMAVARRSLHAARSLAAGHRLQAGDVVALRPGSGVSPARLPDLIGLALSRPLAAGELLTLEHVDGAS